MPKVVLAYIPALHAGYKKFFELRPDFKTLYIVNSEIIQNVRPLQKDIRALDPESVKQAVSGWDIFETIEVVSVEDIKKLNLPSNQIVMPSEDISHKLAHNYLKDAKITFSPIFLRWDRKRSNAQDPVAADITISHEALDKAALKLAYQESEKSSDIWRRVGAVITKNGKTLSTAYNEASPTLYSASILGDPRNNYNKGIEIEKSIFMHAEAKLIAEAAKDGTKLDGLDMYVTTFPCPACAKLIAFSGIKRLFFVEGYAVLDGEELLKTHGVQLIKVDMEPPKDSSISLPYPEK